MWCAAPMVDSAIRRSKAARLVRLAVPSVAEPTTVQLVAKVVSTKSPCVAVLSSNFAGLAYLCVDLKRDSSRPRFLQS